MSGDMDNRIEDLMPHLCEWRENLERKIEKGKAYDKNGKHRRRKVVAINNFIDQYRHEKTLEMVHCD